MALKNFIPVKLEIASCIIDFDFVIHGLPCPVSPTGAESGRRDGAHVWIRDMFSHHWYSKLPLINFFVIGCRDKSFAIVHESKGVDSSHVLLIRLNNIFLICIKLDNFLVVKPSQEHILLRWMKLYAERSFSI